MNSAPPNTNPSITPNAPLTDGREVGEYSSHYCCCAHFQIVAELVYLGALLLTALYFLFEISKSLILQENSFYPSLLGQYPQNQVLITGIVLFLSALCGGCSFALKWLYHTVAKKLWHVDRWVWRITVPVLSAVLSLFTGAMIGSGLIPVKVEAISNPLAGAAFGFFAGYFSDNVLASLQKLAQKIFGTSENPD